VHPQDGLLLFGVDLTFSLITHAPDLVSGKVLCHPKPRDHLVILKQHVNERFYSRSQRYPLRELKRSVNSLNNVFICVSSMLNPLLIGYYVICFSQIYELLNIVIGILNKNLSP